MLIDVLTVCKEGANRDTGKALTKASCNTCCRVLGLNSRVRFIYTWCTYQSLQVISDSLRCNGLSEDHTAPCPVLTRGCVPVHTMWYHDVMSWGILVQQAKCCLFNHTWTDESCVQILCTSLDELSHPYEHYSDVIMSAMTSQITGVSISKLFVQPHIKENIKGPRHWPSWGESAGDRWIPLPKGQ